MDWRWWFLSVYVFFSAVAVCSKMVSIARIALAASTALIVSVIWSHTPRTTSGPNAARTQMYVGTRSSHPKPSLIGMATTKIGLDFSPIDHLKPYRSAGLSRNPLKPATAHPGRLLTDVVFTSPTARPWSNIVVALCVMSSLGMTVILSLRAVAQRVWSARKQPVMGMAAVAGAQSKEPADGVNASRLDADVAAASRWNAAYQLRTERTYRDRHYLRRAFPESVGAAARADPSVWQPPLCPDAAAVARRDLTAPPLPGQLKGKQLLLEMGCGVGNAALPLLRANPNLFAFCMDFSSTAIDMLRKSPEYDPDRMFAFVGDARRPLPDFLPVGQMHFVTMVFTLSAIDPGHWPQVGRSVVRALRPGGLVFLRDFATGDAMQGEGERERVGEGMWLRQDGTLLNCASREEVGALFPGLWELELGVVEHEVVNRKKALRMERRWLQGKWQKPVEEGCVGE